MAPGSVRNRNEERVTERRYEIRIQSQYRSVVQWQIIYYYEIPKSYIFKFCLMLGIR